MREPEPTVKRRWRLCGTEQAGCFAQNCIAACVDQGCGRLMRIKAPAALIAQRQQQPLRGAGCPTAISASAIGTGV